MASKQDKAQADQPVAETVNETGLKAAFESKLAERDAYIEKLKKEAEDARAAAAAALKGIPVDTEVNHQGWQPGVKGPRTYRLKSGALRTDY